MKNLNDKSEQDLVANILSQLPLAPSEEELIVSEAKEPGLTQKDQAFLSASNEMLIAMLSGVEGLVAHLMSLSPEQVVPVIRLLDMQYVSPADAGNRYAFENLRPLTRGRLGAHIAKALSKDHPGQPIPQTHGLHVLKHIQKRDKEVQPKRSISEALTQAEVRLKPRLAELSALLAPPQFPIQHIEFFNVQLNPPGVHAASDDDVTRSIDLTGEIDYHTNKFLDFFQVNMPNTVPDNLTVLVKIRHIKTDTIFVTSEKEPELSVNETSKFCYWTKKDLKIPDGVEEQEVEISISLSVK